MMSEQEVISSRRPGPSMLSEYSPRAEQVFAPTASQDDSHLSEQIIAAVLCPIPRLGSLSFLQALVGGQHFTSSGRPNNEPQ